MFQAGPMALVGSLGVVAQVVLLALFLFSILSWAVILSKWRVFRSADADDVRFMAVLYKAKDIDEVLRHAHRSEKSPCARVFYGVVERVFKDGTLGHKTRLGSSEFSHEDAGEPVIDRHTIERTATHFAQAQLARLEI